MNKVFAVAKLLLSILSRLTGALFAVVGVDFARDKDYSTAIVALLFAAVMIFLPDLIANRIAETDKK